VSLLDQGQWWIVQRWLERIPEQTRKSKVDLLLAELRIFEDTWKLEDISSILSTLESLGIENSDSKTRSYYLFHLGHQYTWARADAKKATEYLEQSKLLYTNEAMFGARREVILAIARQMLGKSALALKSLDDIEKNFSPSSLMHIRSLHSRVFVHILSGNMPDATTASERFHFATRNCDYKTVEAFSSYFRGNIAFQTFNEDVAEQAFCSTLGFNGMLNYRAYFDAMAGLILFSSLKGDEKVTESIFQEMNKKVATIKDTKLQIYYRSVRARVNWHIGQGDKELSWAQTDWTRQSPASYFFLIDVPDLTKVRIIVSHGSILEVQEALHVLADVVAFLNGVHNQYHSIDIEVLKAMALLRIGRKEHANESLIKALLLAEKRDTIRPVMEAYRVMPALFNQVEQSIATSRVLARIGLKSSSIKSPSKSVSKTDELSIREQEVIRLIAKGLRNKEIADQLGISTVTVKSHLTNIYRKLEVANRTSMLNKVRNLEIFS
jgi:ATP/maltotriose-dependent transcriptional regulator MalT